eukprot:3696043-Amphidinium_carterae.1
MSRSQCGEKTKLGLGRAVLCCCASAFVTVVLVMSFSLPVLMLLVDLVVVFLFKNAVVGKLRPGAMLQDA